MGADAFGSFEGGHHVFLVEEGGVDVVEIVDFEAWDALTDEAFDVEDVREFLGGHDGEGFADGLGAACSANAVDVVFGVLGDVVVDDVADTCDIDAACGDVGGDHDFVASGFEAFEGIDAFGLGAVGVECGDGVVALFELAGDAVGSVLGAAENEDAVEICAFEKGEEEVEFLINGDGVKGVGDGLGRGASGTDLDAFGVFQAPCGEALDFLGNGGGEKQGLSFLWALIDDAAHVGKEAHVKHAIDFVEDEELERAEVDEALLHVVEKAAWSGDDDVAVAFEVVALFAVAHSAVDEGDFGVHEAHVVAESCLHLHGEFACGLEDEAADAWFGVVEF